MGLIQRIIEAAGIPTVGITVNRPYTEKVKPPRSIFLQWPFGHPLGEPGHVEQQTAVVCKGFEALYTIDTPGQILDVGWRWRRERYTQPTNSPCMVADKVEAGDAALRHAPAWRS